MHVGARRDRRLGAPALINAVSVMNLGDALATFRLRGGYDGWPHEEPRATSSEVLHSIHGLGVTLVTYHHLRQQRFGGHSEAAVCWEHKFLSQTLGLAVQHDRFDGDARECALAAGDSRRHPLVCGEVLARKGAHDALSDCHAGGRIWP